MNETCSSKGENDGLPGPIISMGERSVNGLFPPVPPATAWPGPVERRDSPHGICRDLPDQCSARLGAKPSGTKRVSAPARVVSGWEPKKREETSRDRGQCVFCSLVALDRSRVGQRRETFAP